MKEISFFLLLMNAASATYAASGSVDVANVDKNIGRRIASSAVAPAVTEKHEYYDVCGCNEEELQCDIKKKCIQWNDGKKYDAVTTWDMKWDYGYDRDSQTCAADSFKVTVEILFRYPRWVRTRETSPRLVEKWDRYMKNLITHENGHRDIAVEAAEKLTRAVAAMAPASTCVEIDRRVRALYRARMEKLNEDQKAYDAATNHGVTQGALFP